MDNQQNYIVFYISYFHSGQNHKTFKTSGLRNPCSKFNIGFKYTDIGLIKQITSYLTEGLNFKNNPKPRVKQILGLTLLCDYGFRVSEVNFTNLFLSVQLHKEPN